MSLGEVERLVAELEALPDAHARATARALMAAVLELHGAGLGRLVELARAAGESGRLWMESAARDPAVSSLLLLHGLHPVDLQTRVARALADVPGAELVDITDGETPMVRVRARAGSAGAVEARLTEAAPDAVVTVEREDGAGFVPVGRLRTVGGDGTGNRQQATGNRQQATGDGCELCGAALPEQHEHLAAAGGRELTCACGSCALLFTDGGGARRRVEHRVERLPLVLADETWAALAIPVSAVYFVRGATGGGTAFYPSPAGATASPLDGAAWSALAAAHPELDALAPDVEAVLIDRNERAAWRVSIDECHRLTGLLRHRWRGISGGDEVQTAVRGFFAGLDGATRA